MSATAPLGIITGLRFEADIIERHSRQLDAAAPLVAAVGGRSDAARREAERMVDQGVRALVSFGTAGALDPALDPGTLVCARSVMSSGGDRIACDADWLQAFTVALPQGLVHADADLVSVQEAAFTIADKKRLACTAHAGAVDMESFAVAQVASSRDMPFLAVRVIADDAEHDLPPAARVAMAADGSIRISRVLLALLAQPSQLPALLRLGRQNSMAKRTLDLCARAGLPWFGLI